MPKTSSTPLNTRRANLTPTKGPKVRPNDSLWFLHSIIRDESLFITGDIWARHFFICEGDSTIVSADYAPSPVTVWENGEKRIVQFRALVRFIDGHSEYRFVEPSGDMRRWSELAAKEMGSASFVVTQSWLDAHRCRELNWMRLLAYWRRCRHRPLELTDASLLCRLTTTKVSIQDVLSWFGDEERCLVPASIARLVRRRVIGSDLDQHSWSASTSIWRLEV